MNYLDLTIIYLACGSPFGVYYYLNNYSKNTWVVQKSFLIIIIWFLYAIKLLHVKVTFLLTKYYFAKNKYLDSNKTQNLILIQKVFENEVFQTSVPVSLFETREIFERYIGLTNLSKRNYFGGKDKTLEIYKISDNRNPEVSTICLNRRNHFKLISHQTRARTDFIRLIEIFLKQNDNPKILGNLALKFVKILKDVEAEDLIKHSLEKLSQTSPPSPVTELEKIYGKS